MLGRDPESSFVIADAKSSPVGAFIRALMGSGEFQSAVLDKLSSTRALPHESASLAPAPEQLDWLFRHVRLPNQVQIALRVAPGWREWLRVLVAVPGFPLPPGRAGAAASEPGIAAQAADDGFVLVHLEQPKSGDRILAGALVSGSGWAIAPADVTEVAVHLDQTLLTHARYGLPRPDVARSFPHYRQVDHCGFAFTAEIPSGAQLTGRSQLIVTVRTVRGELGRKSVRLQPPSALPGPVGGSTVPDGWPIRLAVEEALVDSDRTLRVRGWAVSQRPMRAVTASLGEAGLGEATHGLPRPDIARVHPGYGNAGQSGFALVHHLPPDLPAGPGFVRVQAEDEMGQTRQAIVPVVLPTPPAHEDEGRSGAIRCACDIATLSASGAFEVGGWAFAAEGDAVVEIALDGDAIGSVRTGRARPDVARRHPEEPRAGQCGFWFQQMFAPMAAGSHELVLRIAIGPDERLIRRSLVVGAEQAAEAHRGAPAAQSQSTDMRLEVDRPVLDGDVAPAPVRGALTVSGWAVARDGIAEVSVFCDDLLLGHAHLGMRREDIGSVFADYEGSLLAGYALVMPPGTVPEGVHRMRIVATGRVADGAAGDPPTVERGFALKVEHHDALSPEGDIRQHIPPAEIAFGLALLARHGHRPIFDIAIAAAAGSASALQGTLDTLLGQAYAGWTATVGLASKAAGAEPAFKRLKERAAGRLSFTWPGKAARQAAKTVQPRFVMRLRAGDRLGADALLALAIESAAERDAELIYADDLREDMSQGRRQPFFKPDWSPDLLLAMNYVGRSWCASQALAERAGVSQAVSDYDAVLRLTEQAARIRHVPRVLCDQAQATDTQSEEGEALTASLLRRGIAAVAEAGPVPRTWRVRRSLVPARRGRGARAMAAGRVSIIIPTCAAGGLIRTAIKTIRATTAPARPGGREVEIILLDNTPPRETRMRSWLRQNADIVLDMPGAFNWSRFNNEGARAATGQYLLFLNDDIETAQPDWLEAMIEHAQRPEVGVVGARLLYPDGKVQHGGQYLADAHARHAFRFADSAMPGPFGLAGVAREMISVTGACQMVRATVFKQLGGFEEAHSVVNNDLDFCLRSWRAGLSVVFTPHATLTHHELASRAALQDSYDEARFVGAWRSRFLHGDPFRNPRLNPEGDHYGADPEPAMVLHVGRRGPAIADIRRILAVKLDHIGDFLTALPALRSLAARFPGARIDLLAPSASAELARLEPVIAETIVFDFFHARSGDGKRGLDGDAFQVLRARLAEARYDLAIDLRMQPETREVLTHTGAGFLVGYDRDNRFPFLDVALEWEGDERLVAKRAHVSERLVQLVSAAVDACSDDVAPPVPAVLPTAAVPALAALPSAFLARPLVCVHPGVGNFVRQWPPRHYASLIDLLAQAGLHVVLIGGPDEAPIAEEVLRLVTVPGHVESLVGRVKLGELAQVMRGCVLFVGNNSGPQHLAASLGVPSVGIHSGVVDAVEWAPLGVPGPGHTPADDLQPLLSGVRVRLPARPCLPDRTAPGRRVRRVPPLAGARQRRGGVRQSADKSPGDKALTSRRATKRWQVAGRGW